MEKVSGKIVSTTKSNKVELKGLTRTHMARDVLRSGERRLANGAFVVSAHSRWISGLGWL